MMDLSVGSRSSRTYISNVEFKHDLVSQDLPILLICQAHPTSNSKLPSSSVCTSAGTPNTMTALASTNSAGKLKGGNTTTISPSVHSAEPKSSAR
jgi:hypothetical protein